MPGQIPLLDELDAAKFAGYTSSSWFTQSRGIRIFAVAQYYMSLLLEVHRQDAVSVSARQEQN